MLNMKAVLALELRNDNVRQLMKLAQWECDQVSAGLGKAVIGSMPSSTWCAEILGYDSRFGYQRGFLKYKKDYAHSNSVGSRGVHAIYLLEEGRLYEVKEWKDRYFCIVQNWEIHKIDKTEVVKWLSGRSVLMS